MLYDMNRRSDYIDIMKALAIFCVIIGHCELTSSFFRQLIYAFHMPAFFIAYGLSYDDGLHLKHNFLTSHFIIQKFRRLMVPCILWGLIYTKLTAQNIIYLIYGSQKCFYKAGSLSSLWFLPCMFLAVTLFEGMMTFSHEARRSKRQGFSTDAGMAIAALGIAYIAAKVPKLTMGYPFSADVSLMACSFIVFGYMLRKLIQKVAFLNEGKPLFYSALLLISTTIVLKTFPYNLANLSTSNVDLASGNYGNLILFFADAAGGSLALISISVLALKIPIQPIKKALLWIGQNTFLIFVIHKPLVIWLGNLVSEFGFEPFDLAIPVCIVVLMICVCLSSVIKRTVPILSGEDISQTVKV